MAVHVLDDRPVETGPWRRALLHPPAESFHEHGRLAQGAIDQIFAGVAAEREIWVRTLEQDEADLKGLLVRSSATSALLAKSSRVIERPNMAEEFGRLGTAAQVFHALELKRNELQPEVEALAVGTFTQLAAKAASKELLHRRANVTAASFSHREAADQLGPIRWLLWAAALACAYFSFRAIMNVAIGLTFLPSHVRGLVSQGFYGAVCNSAHALIEQPRVARAVEQRG